MRRKYVWRPPTRRSYEADWEYDYRCFSNRFATFRVRFGVRFEIGIHRGEMNLYIHLNHPTVPQLSEMYATTKS